MNEKNTLSLNYKGVKIRSISNGFGFILYKVFIIAKDKEDKKKRLLKFKQVKDKIVEDIDKLGWKTIFDGIPEVRVTTESYFKKMKSRGFR